MTMRCHSYTGFLAYSREANAEGAARSLTLAALFRRVVRFWLVLLAGVLTAMLASAQ